MRPQIHGFLLACICASQALTARTTSPHKIPRNAVLLSNIKTLTLRAGKDTSHRRVSAVPQLKCAGPSDLCNLYSVDVMRCQNGGSDYDDESIQWTCTASLPEEFKLGSTDVMCEGYESSDDPYVLKGSCGVEYRLALTNEGEDKFGGQRTSSWGTLAHKTWAEKVGHVLFWCLFLGIACLIMASAFGCLGTQGGRRPTGAAGGGGPYYGGGGGPDDPPPPYDWQPPWKSTTTRSYRSSATGSQGSQPWRPGFWSGAAGGAAAGYVAGRSQQRQQQQQQPRQGGGWFGGGGSNAGGGSSRPSTSSSYSSTRHSSTGFGSTSRR